MAKQLTADDFDKEVKEFDGVVLVDFWAAWCGPCKMLGPVIEQLAQEYESNEKVKIAKLNVDENQQLAQEYGIMSIPAMKFFKNGEVVDEIVGLQPIDAIKQKLEELA